MARRRRIFLTGTAQHVVQRGNNRGDIFRSTGDYELFLLTLADAAVRFQVLVHAYALMTNHFHLLATPAAAGSIPQVMQAIGRRYVPYFNERYNRTGGLFQGRFRSTVVGDERYVMTCMRYIELNPVRAGLVTGPESYRWSSYPTHAMAVPSGILAPHDVYTRLGAADTERCRSWQAFCAQAVPDSELHELRADLESTRHRGLTPVLHVRGV